MKDEAPSGKSGMLNIPILIVLVIGLIVVNAFIYKGIFAPHSAEADVFAVGKSEAMLLRTASGASILIDTGSDASVLRVLGQALPPWQRTVGAVIITSDKAAQTGGLSSLESRYAIGPILRAGTQDLPYGTTLTLDNLSVSIISPGIIALSSSASSLTISSSTPPGAYPLFMPD